MTLIFILTLVSSILTAPPNGVATITRDEPLQPYEAIWNAVCAVESSGNPLAIGDKHLSEHSFGICQIRMVRLDDYYKRTGIRYAESDMFDPAKAKIVFMYYASMCKPWDNESISRSWNAGPRWEKVSVSKDYYLKVKRLL